jgi:hypothetical protein
MFYSQILIFLFSTLQPNHSFAQEVFDKGYRLPTESVTKDFTLMALSLEEDFLTRYIIKTNYQINKDEAALIAHHILKVSACFNIDPWVLTGLVQKESSFQKDAVSSSDASGLTQFTNFGFQEVNDQLGFHGKAGATEASTFYFTQRLRECIDPNWTDLWIRAGLPEEDPNFYTVLKNQVKSDIPLALTYGAILLKTYVSYIDVKSIRNNSPLSLSETYYQALQIYNGEDGDAKVNYAKGVFNNLKALYPKEVNFPFLLDQ